MPPKRVSRRPKKKKKTINNSTQPPNPTTTSSNPFDPSDHNNFIIQKHQPSFTFNVVDDLDAFITEGGNTATQALLNLPIGIFLDILSRLSIKHLAVCRCVCKTWGTLIHHPHFSKLHHLKAIEKLKHPFPQTSLLFHVNEYVGHVSLDDDDVVFSEIFLLEHEKNDNFKKGVFINPQFMPPVIPTKLIETDFYVIGSCNGLILLGEPYFTDPIYVCNPVIGEYLALPPCDKDNKWHIEKASGLGFDQAANEYKVVRASYNIMELTSSTRMEVEVYTLGSGRWRNLGKFSLPRMRIFKSSQVFINGALHWLATENKVPKLIVSFDVGKEELQLVSFPPLDSQITKLILGELGGNLCLFAHSSDDCCQVWAMKQYGVEGSWAKEYVISRKVFRLTGVTFKPVKFMENGDILLEVNNRLLVCYNPRKKRFIRKLKLTLPPKFEAFTHVSSLISLKDFVAPTDGSRHSINTGGWFGVMKSITSHLPEFDIRGWKLNLLENQLW